MNLKEEKLELLLNFIPFLKQIILWRIRMICRACRCAAGYLRFMDRGLQTPGKRPYTSPNHAVAILQIFQNFLASIQS